MTPPDHSTSPEPTSPQQRDRFRSRLFRYLDGFPIAPTIAALEKHSVLDLFQAKQTVSLEDVVRQSGGNEGYLQVALRLLCSQGWLVQDVNARTDSIRYTTTSWTAHAFRHAQAYTEIDAYLPLAARMDDYLFGKSVVPAEHELSAVVERHRLRWGMRMTGDPGIDVVIQQILLHIEGLLVGPVLVALGMRGLLERYTTDRREISASDFGGDATRCEALLVLFEQLGWTENDGSGSRVSAEGLFHFQRAAAYGVTVSYLPMFQRVEELLFGDPHVLWNREPGKPEIHVDRRMNVWGSGGAHAAYFRKIDEIVIDIFNRPIDEQPLGIADMGCGNGAFLEHIFDVIWHSTERGKVLDDHPLFIVGSDFNQAALEVTKENLGKADVWAKVVFGDIADPVELSQQLKNKYGVELSDLLSVRSFLDHNREYVEPERIDPERESRSTGAFSRRGRRITSNAIEQNLVDHLRCWTPFVRRFGLLVLELHTIQPKMAALNIGRTNVTAYDGTHGYSDQYILELEVFLKAAHEAGLVPIPEFQAKYPSSDLASISVNLLRATS